MKSKRSQKTAEKRVDRRGGYQLTRDKDGLTPMQRLSARKADLAEIEIAEKLGNLVSKEHVEAGLREGGEVIGSDLFGTLVSRVVSEFAGRDTMTPQHVRAAMTGIVHEIVAGWQKAGVVRE